MFADVGRKNATPAFCVPCRDTALPCPVCAVCDASTIVYPFIISTPASAFIPAQ